MARYFGRGYCLIMARWVYCGFLAGIGSLLYSGLLGDSGSLFHNGFLVPAGSLYPVGLLGRMGPAPLLILCIRCGDRQTLLRPPLHPEVRQEYLEHVALGGHVDPARRP